MTALVWDTPGERVYQTGVDRGVLYLPDGGAVAWNGLTNVEESPQSTDAQDFFLDGVKYMQKQAPSDFQASLGALTYPDEFESILGIEEASPGLAFYNQAPKQFSLSYRTRIGNDTEGIDLGYKIHLLYNVRAVPDASHFESMGSDITPVPFTWTISGVPPLLSERRPTVHVSIDSRKADPARLAAIEKTLYGSDTTAPVLPDIEDLIIFYEQYDALTIIDNGDGTWTAIDPADAYLTIDDPENFTITADGAVPIDADTYTLSTTTP